MKRAAKLHRFARQIAGKLEKDKPPFPTQEMIASTTVMALRD